MISYIEQKSLGLVTVEFVNPNVVRKLSKRFNDYTGEDKGFLPENVVVSELVKRKETLQAELLEVDELLKDCEKVIVDHEKLNPPVEPIII